MSQKLPTRDDRPVEAQLQDLVVHASQRGMFDAAAWIQMRLPAEHRLPDPELLLRVLDPSGTG